MSRCFPYPPPWYVKNGIRNEALIESIKIKREEEKAKKERKKEKKEKKERDKSRDSGEAESKKHGHKERHIDERRKEDKKLGDHQKKRENEMECFKKSTLTEEHGQSVGPQNSSDSTLNSSKRQKLSRLLTVSKILEALSRPDCLLKGIKILKNYPARNSLALPQETLIRPLINGCMSMLLDQTKNRKNNLVRLSILNARSKLSSSAKKKLAPLLAHQKFLLIMPRRQRRQTCVPVALQN
ncbi:hypothetical protein J1N35_026139 [Gossypium stocksii]|uniref:Uncharacterized protein n=1 Tax=Gossypium stocksii TaxID=47602 RepID=A0A9D3V8B0_9ROSI|nr:hypothetical protein J1N35_026139 [Gossypium stocksii]